MIYKGVVINPDKYLLPSYKLGPFSAKDIGTNKELPKNNICDTFFERQFLDYKITYTINGREALNLALQNCSLSKEDVVTILTPSQNFYISSCVTNEIEKFCRWDREITVNTKVILVNHEFGIGYEQLEELKKKNFLIIEDCAHAFGSSLEDRSIGRTGDYIIFSFPKFFPLQIGGLLLSKKEVGVKGSISEQELHYIKNVISYYIDSIAEFSKKRKDNCQYLADKISALGCKPRFDVKKGTVPGVFMFEVPSNINAILLKDYFFANGVECSVFYKENAVFIPCHHNLTMEDLDYFLSLIFFYFKNI